MRSIWMTPTPTSGVSAEVVIDDDWTQIVMPRPERIGEVAREPLHRDGEAAALNVGDVAVDRAVEPDGDAALEELLERVDDQEERDAEGRERDGEDDPAGDRVGDVVALDAEEVLEHAVLAEAAALGRRDLLLYDSRRSCLAAGRRRWAPRRRR